MDVVQQIAKLADDYAVNLRVKVDERVKEMADDDKSHYLIYRVLGVSADEGDLIDIYQNKGRFLYRYAGSFLERAAKLCFTEKFPECKSVRIPNALGQRPRTFEIDCLIGNVDAVEIKWRDATTDGDHITKEHTRVQNVALAGYRPVRVMFYYPNRVQAQRIQAALETLYVGAGGLYYYGDAAWQYILNRTEVDLKAVLESIAEKKAQNG